jgi:hypothetical protein
LTRRGLLLLPSAARAAAPLFEEAPARSGILRVHENAMSGQRCLLETLGPGCAFFDYDNDGWIDLYLVNSGPCDFYQPDRPLRNALYKNNRNGTFRDFAIEAGVAGGAFGMGVAAADYNNDGYPDLFVTAYGRSILYRNNGDGAFSDVTEKAGVAAPGWTTSAVWFDYDNDGLLDLFVCNCVQFGLDLQTRGDDTTHRRTTAYHAFSNPPAACRFTSRATAPLPKPAAARRSNGPWVRRSVWSPRTSTTTA